MEGTTLKDKVMKGFLWLTTATFITQSITWVVTIVVIRLLSPSDYGLLAMSNTFIFILTTIANMGINSSLIQSPELTDRDIRNVFGIVLAATLICSLLSYAVAPLVASFYGEERVAAIIRLMTLNFCIIGFYLVPEALNAREMNFKLKAKIETVARVGSSLATLAFAYSGMGVWSLVWGLITLHLLKLIAYNIAVSFQGWPLFNFQESKSFFFYGSAVTGDRLLYGLYNQLDKIIIGKTLGDKLLGIYSVAINLASMPNDKILPIINQVSFTSYARIQDNKDRLRRNLLRATRVIAGISFPAFFGMSAISPLLIPLVLGENWLSATLPFQLLCLIMPVRAVSTTFSPAVFALGEPKVNMVNMLFTCIVMSIAFIIGTHWGIFGVCLSWLIIFPLVVLIVMSRCLKVIGISLRTVVGEILFPFFASSCMMVIVMVFQHTVTGLTNTLLLPLSIILGATCYGLLVLAFYREQYLEILRLLR